MSVEQAARELISFLRKTMPRDIQINASDTLFAHALAVRLETLEAALGKGRG